MNLLNFTPTHKEEMNDLYTNGYATGRVEEVFNVEGVEIIIVKEFKVQRNGTTKEDRID